VLNSFRHPSGARLSTSGLHHCGALNGFGFGDTIRRVHADDLRIPTKPRSRMQAVGADDFPVESAALQVDDLKALRADESHYQESERDISIVACTRGRRFDFLRRHPGHFRTAPGLIDRLLRAKELHKIGHDLGSLPAHAVAVVVTADLEPPSTATIRPLPRN